MASDSQLNDPVRHLVRTRIADLGLEMADVSRKLDKNQTYIQQYLTKGSPKWLPEEVRYPLAVLLDISEESLRRPISQEFPQARSIQQSPLFRATGGNRDKQVHLDSVVVAHPQVIRGRNVLLLDDVTTSGNSLQACRDLLYQAGATTVECAAIAKT